MKNKPVRVWQAPVRIVHWLLALAIAAAWVTREQTGELHANIGYGAAVLVVLRLTWGWFGNRYAQLASFVRPPGATLAYLRQVLRGRAARHIGHNPLGGAMAALLWSCVGLLAASGWALNTDLLWGYAWPVQVHAALAWLLLILIGLHLAGVLFTSWQHRENLVRAMITGTKPGPSPDDIDTP